MSSSEKQNTTERERQCRDEFIIQMRIDNAIIWQYFGNNFAGIIKNKIAGARCVLSSLISCDPRLHGGVEGGHGQDGELLLKLEYWHAPRCFTAPSLFHKIVVNASLWPP